MTNCHSCGEIIKIIGDEHYYNPDGEEFCIDCFFGHYCFCVVCGDVVEEDDCCNFNGEDYCSNCFFDDHFYCGRCGETYYRNDGYDGGGALYCEECFFEYFNICGGCESSTHVDDSYYSVSLDEYFCYECFSQEHATCEGCSEGYLRSDMRLRGGLQFCKFCRPPAKPETYRLIRRRLNRFLESQEKTRYLQYSRFGNGDKRH